MCLRINRDFGAAIMLMKFGLFITHLCIDGENSFSDLCDPYKRDWHLYEDSNNFGMMMMHCTALKCIKFRKVPFWNMSVWKLRNIFRNIDTLVLEDCIGITQRIPSLLNVCKKLKHLILGPNNHNQEPADLFSSMIEFGQDMETIRLKMDSTYETDQFWKFLKRLAHLKKLKTLELGLIWEYPITARINHALASIDSLEKLILRRFIPNEGFFKTLNRFTKLRVCKLLTNETVTDAVRAFATDFAITSVKDEHDDFGDEHDEDELDDFDHTQTHPTTTYTITLVRNN